MILPDVRSARAALTLSVMLAVLAIVPTSLCWWLAKPLHRGSIAASIHRIVTPERRSDDVGDTALRPQLLSEFVGQAQARKNFAIFIEAARKRDEALDHVLFVGPPGLGKTTLAQIVARELGVGFRATSGPVIAKAGDLAALLTNLEERDVLFIDEIHRLSPAVEEVLYPAMEDFQLDLIIGEGPAPRTPSAISASPNPPAIPRNSAFSATATATIDRTRSLRRCTKGQMPGALPRRVCLPWSAMAMGSTEDADMLALIAAAPELATPDDTEVLLDAMPISELASMWGAVQRLSRRDRTGATWSAFLYFDHLPHKRPDRALDLALEVLGSEPDKPTVMQLNDKFMLSLLYAHGAAVIGRIESEAKQNAGLRWLLGGMHFGPDEPLNAASRRLPTAGAGASTISRAGRRNTRSSARRCRCRNWRVPGSSDIRNPNVTAMTISSR